MFDLGYNFAGTGGITDYPAESDVRYGVEYANSTLTGTLILPSIDVGIENTPTENLKNNIAASATFQEWTGEDYIGARLRIYENGLTKNTDLQSAAPYAYIRSDENNSWNRISFGIDGFDNSGSLELHFDSVVDEAESADEEAIQLSEVIASCDQIVREVLANSGNGGYLAIESIQRLEAFLSDETETYNLIHVQYRVNWR